MAEPHNPYAAPAVTASTVDALDTTVSDRRYRWAQALAIVCVAGSPVASALAVMDIESILGSGPILALLCLTSAILAWPPMLRPLLLISVAGIAIVIGCFVVINLCEWGPTEARKPIGQATVILAILMQAGWIPIRRVAKARSQSEKGQKHSVAVTDTMST
jgi:hypothetical protein